MGPPQHFQGRKVDTTDSVHINARAGDLRDELANQNGAYRDVTEMYADEMGMRDAFQNGQDVDKLTAPLMHAQRRRAPQANAMEAWSIGARTKMADRASEFGTNHPTGNTAGTVRQMLGPDAKQAAIQDMMPDRPNAVAGLQDRLEAEQQGNILWREVQGNSKTAERQQSDRDLDQQIGGVEIPSMSPLSLATRAANLVSAGVAKGVRTDVKEQVARIVTERDPARQQALIDEIAAAIESDRLFADRLHQRGLIVSKSGAMNVEAPDPGQFSANPDFRADDADY